MGRSKDARLHSASTLPLLGLELLNEVDESDKNFFLLEDITSNEKMIPVVTENAGPIYNNKGVLVYLEQCQNPR